MAARVAVGIPTYNRSGMLAETIQSVLAQTFGDFVLIVSDNASTDDTTEVVGAFGDDRIEYHRASRNLGAAGNFRRVLELAGGSGADYLVILPDDDHLYPGHLEAAVALLDRTPQLGLVHTAFHLIDDESRVTNTMRPLGSRTRVEPSGEALERLMVDDFPICFSSVVYRTRAIVDNGGIRAEEEPFGDIQLWMRIALDWDFGYVGEPLAGFRIHDASTTNNISASSDQRDLALMHTHIRTTRRMNFLASAGLPPRRERQLRAYATLHDLAERAYWGLPTRSVATELRGIVRRFPAILGRPAFARLVLAQLGMRRMFGALRRTSSRAGRLLHSEV